MPQLQSPTRRRFCHGLALAGLALAARPLTAAASILTEPADRILVLKSARTLRLLRGSTIVAEYPVALGAHPIGRKRQQGDKRTPEGTYRVDALNPQSRYHRAMHLSYPNADDIERARAAGLAPGGDIEIHGLPRGYEHYDPAVFAKDWTDGCIAVSNRAIDEIWTMVQIDTVVQIRA